MSRSFLTVPNAYWRGIGLMKTDTNKFYNFRQSEQMAACPPNYYINFLIVANIL